MLILPLLFSARASAECDGDKCSAPVEAGEPSPYSGVVLSNSLAQDLLSGTRECKSLVEIEKATCTLLLKNEKARAEALVAVSETASKDRERILTEALHDEQARSRDLARQKSDEEFEHLLWAGGGAAAGAVVTMATMFVIVAYVSLSQPL